MWIASVAWVLLVAGYLNRRNRTLHIRLMLAGIVTDISLVLFLQFTRGAIQKALGFTLAVIQQLHILSSTIALLLYFPILFFGFKLVRGDFSPEVRERHIKLGKMALLFRTIGFLLMFSMWKS